MTRSDEDRLADEMAIARSAHLSDFEMQLVKRYAKLSRKDIDGPPVGVIVGPSGYPHGHSRYLPFPPGSIGHRLLKLSAMTPSQYLGRFLRFNLFDEYVPKSSWSAADATARATNLVEQLAAQGSFRLLLLGKRVADAFGVDEPWQLRSRTLIDAGGETTTTIACIAIVHPDDEPDLYLTSERVPFAAGGAIRWAAELIA